MTNGEYLVGIDFNPSQNPDVRDLKKAAAALIDMVENFEAKADPDIVRLQKLAVTHIETAAMWAVKAVTKKARE